MCNAEIIPQVARSVKLDRVMLRARGLQVRDVACFDRLTAHRITDTLMYGHNTCGTGVLRVLHNGERDSNSGQCQAAADEVVYLSEKHHDAFFLRLDVCWRYVFGV